VHEYIVRFKQAIDASSALNPKTAEVIKSEFTLFPDSTTLSQFNSDFLLKHKDSARHIITSVRVRHSLHSSDISEDEADLLIALNLPGTTLEEAIEGLELLSSLKSSKPETYRSNAKSKWPEATAFQDSD
jgi:peptide alpha-N-acetyltransferase